LELHTIGIDLGKTVFHLAGLNLRGEVAKSGRTNSRRSSLAFVGNSKELYFSRRGAVSIPEAHSKTGGFCEEGGN